MKLLILDYLKLFYRTIVLILRCLQKLVSPNAACFLQNIFLFLLGSQLRFKFDARSSLFIAKEKQLIKYFGDMGRGFDLYGRSLFTRGKQLADQYCINKIMFDEDDIVVDCGANYADLYLFLDGKIKQENYIAFEPGPIEYKCISKSLPKAQIHNLGLSNKEGKLDFYLCSKLGDSSFIKPRSYTEIIKVNVVKLDNFASSSGINKCKLLKLEAEGFEPEILIGANNFIKKCEYIAIDGGRERGINLDLTFHTLNNYLLNNDFVMLDIYGPIYRGLYRNIKFDDDKL